jgi:sialate O-acetylesterase
MRPLISLLAILLLTGSSFRGPFVKIACVGDSITFGYGLPKGSDYPSQLERMLSPTVGGGVLNFGVNGATLLRHGDCPYEKQPALNAALHAGCQMVVIMLGTNDTKPQNWGPHHGEFDADYRWLINQFLASGSPGSSPPEIYLCRPCWVSGTNKFGISEQVIEQEIPIIDKIAADMQLHEIDMHAVLKGHPEDFRDTVHPTAAGDALLAQAVGMALIGEGEVPTPTPSSTVSPTP